MNTNADKTQENKSQSVANAVSQKQSNAEATFQFVDNRPEAIAQRELQEMGKNSAQSKQAAQLQTMADNYSAKQQQLLQKKENNTDLPDNLKSGIENLSGHSMDDVKVHYNSDKPTQLNAHAYAQGTDIHLASGQEKHLPHEAWHVVQQKQGRVKATTQMKDKVNVNDDAELEREADVMGAKAIHLNISKENPITQNKNISKRENTAKATNILSDKSLIVQRKVIARIRTKKLSSELPRVISEIRIEGRAPTTVKGAQGDHTVAETLINESVKREIMHQQPKVALNNLMVLANLTLPGEGIAELDNNFFKPNWGLIDEMEGEDKNSVIEEMIQRYIELANKREATAFLRDEELTRGNKGERTAIGGVRELADKLEQGQNANNTDLALVAKHLAVLIDMRYYPDQKDRYSMVILRAVKHAVLSVLPQLTKEQVRFMLARLMSVELGLRDEINSEDQNTILEKIIPEIE